MIRMRNWVQSLLRRFGYQLIRNTRPIPLLGTHSSNDAEIPAEFRAYLRGDNPRLQELRDRYGRTHLPMTKHTWWTPEYIRSSVDLAHFRGDNAYIWQTRHLSQAIQHRYFLCACDIASRDGLKLLDKLKEDGAFGCWVYRFHRFPAISRDLLDSVNELNFLERHASISQIQDLGILDIGAGYGRLAHRSNEALANLRTYYCTDGVPESTFLSEFYLHYRNCTDKTRVVTADRLQELNDAKLHFAVNVHSFSEMSREAIEGWLTLIADLGIPRIFVVPNEPEAFLSIEADGTRRDFLDAFTSRGYRIVAKESAISDLDARELIGVHDHMFLFESRN